MWFASMNLVQVKKNYRVVCVTIRFKPSKIQTEAQMCLATQRCVVARLLLMLSAHPAGFSLPFQQQLLPSFPGTSPVGQHFRLYRLRPAG